MCRRGEAINDMKKLKLAIGIVALAALAVGAAPKSQHATRRRTSAEGIIAAIEAQRKAINDLRADEHTADEDMEIVRRFHEADLHLLQVEEFLRDASKRYQEKE
jgi:hypothetical protein